KILIAVVILAVAAAPACTNKQGETEAPVFITVTLPLQPLNVSASSGAPVQIQTINLNSHLKNPTAPNPQHLAAVEISFSKAVYFGGDGGTLLPPPQEFAAAILVPSNGAATLNNFPVMSASALTQSPFDQLFPFNGGVDRETGLTQIHMFYNLTFFGQTASGQRVQSETATGDFFVTP